MSDRSLVVMRHASARSHAESDHARELTRHGLQEAVATGRELARAGVRPDRALVSDALRARQTWEAVARECGECEVSYEPSLHNAPAETVLEMLSALPDEVLSAIYVGHNPAAEYLAAVLAAGEGEPEVMHDLIRGMPPSTAVVLRVEGTWADLAPGACTLLHVFGPRAR